MNIERSHIRFFNHLVEHGFSVSGTAQALGLSQPTASRLLKELELIFGQALVKRHGRRLQGLTPFGTRLLADFKEIAQRFSNLDHIRREREEAHAPIIHIGCTPVQSQYFLPQIIQRFRVMWPSVRLNISENKPSDLVQTLLKGDIDMAICSEALSGAKNIIAEPLYRWTHQLCVPKDHALAFGDITADRLKAYPILTYPEGMTGRSLLSEWFQQAGVQPQIMIESADTDLIKRLSRRGEGVGLICGMAASRRPLEGTIYRGLQDAPKLTTLYGVHETRYISPFAKSFLTLLARDALSFEDRLL